MLSGKLIRLIERHDEDITAAAIRSIRQNPDLPHLAKLPDPELRERCREILSHLGHWLEHHNEEKLALEYEVIGRSRFKELVPLHEAVCGLYVIKYKLIEFLDGQGIDPDVLALYADAQFVRRIGPFFDSLVMHLVRGYETAWTHTVHPAA